MMLVYAHRKVAVEEGRVAIGDVDTKREMRLGRPRAAVDHHLLGAGRVTGRVARPRNVVFSELNPNHPSAPPRIL